MTESSLPFFRPPAEPYGAFCQDNHVAVAATAPGPLSGLSFAIKDVFDVAGSRTGFGHPRWLATHGPAAETAAAVSTLLDAGADLVGRTISDELCYSIAGENLHYGTPVNPQAPDRIPGGSSSGSAVAVAGGIVDFAIGTDCGGSVRVPAGYCGLYGIRPTHGRIPLDGVARFAPRFDTVGWFARDPEVLRRVGEVLFGAGRRGGFTRLVIADDAFARCDAGIQPVLAGALSRLGALFTERASADLSPEGLDQWLDTFRILQAGEIWQSLGGWIEAERPEFGVGVGQRFAAAAETAPADVDAARARAEEIAEGLAARISEGDLVVLPTTPGPAPLRTTSSSEVETDYRRRAMEILCVAGIGRLPQVTLPVGTVDGAPVGLSILARRGKDMDLLDIAARAGFGVPVPPERR
ncbi:amidase [Xanthobacter tagetidis]|uniref:Amidase n=1 Tax=Xanthobacter tagetidis TaxID=60216 RepID=A0A3L7ADG1_9HYPH|nr:amidase [Xanthobacter tagetidis]MBB6305919.1 amidase [Xanthobacter tagetidis]RLP78439.1 amidase [Xanthobacter tagetidis]